MFPVPNAIAELAKTFTNEISTANWVIPKIVPFVVSAIDGSQIPIGILKSTITDLADAAEATVNVCISGDVVEDKITFQAAETLASVVTIGTGTENTRIVSDMIQSLGIVIVDSEELTGFDNQ